MPCTRPLKLSVAMNDRRPGISMLTSSLSGDFSSPPSANSDSPALVFVS